MPTFHIYADLNDHEAIPVCVVSAPDEASAIAAFRITAVQVPDDYLARRAARLTMGNWREAGRRAREARR